MSKLNVLTATPVFTHEGAVAWPHLTPYQALRRSVLSCLLWEDTFYESGASIADRIRELAMLVEPAKVANLAIEARCVFRLRHAPLWLVLTLVKRQWKGAADAISVVIQRADEMGELLAMYRANKSNKKMIPAQLRKGLASALTRFNEYHLAKYDRDSAAFKLRDVLRLVRPKPKTTAQCMLWAMALNRELPAPDTWEVALSAGADKKETFERLIAEGKLGYLALLRNLRNMAQAGCDDEKVKIAIMARKGGAERVLPFRYIAAARAAPQYEPAIDHALQAAINEMIPLTGLTAIVVDVSGSMRANLSHKSDLTRMDAAAALASIWPGNVRVFSFSNSLVEVPPRRGMAGVDAIIRSQPHGGTYLGQALELLNSKVGYDRLIVITDEQSHDRVPEPKSKHAYLINVAPFKNGVGYGKWTHIDGFSEGVLRFISEIEREETANARAQ